ncbi:MAG: hypothetical protein PWP14_1604 [Methanolobus sp.]|nr:hypothetical protein [Methanolobus sp.]
MFLENTDAVSEVIGEVLMTAIAVLAFSVIAVFILSYAAPQEKVYADIQGWISVDSDKIHLRHTGGETIDVARIRAIIIINGNAREIPPAQLQNIKGNNAWDLGETIEINTSQLWNENINKDDYVAATLVSTDSNLVIKSGTLLGDPNKPGATNTGTSPVLSSQNPPTPYESNTSGTVTFSASSSQNSLNEFLLDGQHLAWSNGTTPSYTNTSAAVGTYELTLIARNASDPLLTDSMQWTWTVIPASGTSEPITGVRMHLQKLQKGGYIEDGGHIQFRTATGGNSITIGSSTTNIANNRDVRLVMNGQQISGEADIGISGGSRRITKYDFNVSFYLDGSLISTGRVNSIYINKADNLDSTLIYQLPSHLSQTYFTENDGSNIIIGWYPDNSSQIRLYNMTPASGVNFRLEFRPDLTYINGFNALYVID